MFPIPDCLSAELFQSSSLLDYSYNPPMPSDTASPKASNPDTHPGIQASKDPSIPACMDPFFDHLEGAALSGHRPHRLPQPAKVLLPESSKTP